MDKKISIVIPVYNVESFLDQCLESVVSQTYENLQIILINDGSTDKSLDICNRYASKDDRISVFNQTNMGLSGARNTGIQKSIGHYIMFLDSDDWLHKSTVSEALKKALEYDVDLVFWKMTKVYNNKEFIGNSPFNRDQLFKDEKLSNLQRRIVGPIGNEKHNPSLIDTFASAWGKLYRTDLIRNSNLEFIDTKIIGSEDILFNVQYFQLMSSAYFINQPLIYYRKDNPNSLTKTHGSSLFPRFKNLFELISKVIVENELSPIYRSALNNRIAISMMNIGLSVTSPRNTDSIVQQINNIGSYLSDPIYKGSYRNLKLKGFAFHWKLFFLACKSRSKYGVFILLKIMRLFIK